MAKNFRIIFNFFPHPIRSPDSSTIEVNHNEKFDNAWLQNVSPADNN